MQPVDPVEVGLVPGIQVLMSGFKLSLIKKKDHRSFFSGSLGTIITD
jgi:hypothetical protein